MTIERKVTPVDAGIDRHLRILKAIADETRLRILGLLAVGPRSGRELADELGLTPPTISHHMRRLVEVGVVWATPDAQRQVYRLEERLLSEIRGDLDGATVGGPASLPATPTGRGDDADEAFRARTLRSFVRAGSLVSIPARRRQRVIVLQHLFERFEPGRDYPEREVNELLLAAHEDFATLRRELVDYGYLERASGVYRVAQTLPERSAQEAQEVPDDEAEWLRALIRASVDRRA